VITGATDGIGRAYAEEVNVFFFCFVFFVLDKFSMDYIVSYFLFYGRAVGLYWSEYRAD
jgi:hypothetical protein